MGDDFMGGESLEKRTVTAPAETWQACEEMAERDGGKLAEVYRRVMTEGISAERERLKADVEFENSMMIHRRLQAKENGALDAVAFLKNHADENVRRAADDLEKWLQKG